MRFTKMQGIGNDYLYLNCFFTPQPEDPSTLARRMSDRHFGVGSDGLVLICPPVSAENDARMRMFNSDGSESEMCGNAARCVGRYLYERGLCRKTEIRLETLGGVKPLLLEADGGRAPRVTVDMGRPLLSAEEIPVRPELLGAPSTAPLPQGLLTVEGAEVPVWCVSMGNPHCIVFVPDTGAAEVERLGAAIERHAAFPRKTNVEFVQVLSNREIRMRVWERGAGETLACGTGACAAAVACALTGRTGREVKVSLPGGSLLVSWSRQGNVLQTGPAEFVFEGDWPDE